MLLLATSIDSSLRVTRVDNTDIGITISYDDHDRVRVREQLGGERVLMPFHMEKMLGNLLSYASSDMTLFLEEKYPSMRPTHKEVSLFCAYPITSEVIMCVLDNKVGFVVRLLTQRYRLILHV